MPGSSLGMVNLLSRPTHQYSEPHSIDESRHWGGSARSD